MGCLKRHAPSLNGPESKKFMPWNEELPKAKPPWITSNFHIHVFSVSSLLEEMYGYVHVENDIKLIF